MATCCWLLILEILTWFLEFIDQNQWIAHWRIQTVIDKTSDEYEVLLRGLFHRDGIALERITNVVLSSVVPSLIPRIRVLIKKLLQKEPLVIGPELYSQLPIKSIESLKKLGVTWFVML